MKLHVRSRHRTLVTAGVASAVLAMLALSPAAGASATPSTATGVPHTVDWRYYGNDLANTRFQNVDQINPSNVTSLQPAWVFHTGVVDPKASFEASPIVVNGTMYVSTGHDDVFALNAATGAQEWAYHPEAQMPPLGTLPLCCGEDSRAVAYGDGKVFLARLDAVLVALNAQTGQVAWQATVANPQAGQSMTMAPQFANGEVIVGLSGGELEARGAAVAFDAASGHRLWTFNTTQPGPTWQGDSWQTGGGAIWGNPTVDPDADRHGLVYVGTGNAAPDFFGGSRAGQNLYTASLVALDLRTGSLEWAFQEVHHDLWDYDGSKPPVLFNATLGGQTTEAVGHCMKDGNVFVLNRITGQPLFPVTEVPVPTQPAFQNAWPTQPMSSVQPLTPMTVGTIAPGITTAPEFTPPQPQPLAVEPGNSGGCEWPPGAYSPRTGDLYYMSRYIPAIIQSFPNNTCPPPGQLCLGSKFTFPLPGVDNHSIIGATSTTTGKVVWRTDLSNVTMTSMAVGGDLLFYGEDSGVFHAVSAATGTPLWSFNGLTVPGAGGADAPPSIYVVNGREYVVEAFGGNAVDRLHFKDSPTGDALIAFALPNK